ncbi:MAG: outer membrane beta-barrel protein, partial [Bacteroidota bacterium]|nr:outer membrane beta-barrel protein [Bacteroidota bacterium]
PSWANTTSINYYFKQKYQLGLAYIYCDPNLLSAEYMRPDSLLLVSEMINQQMTQVGMVNLSIPVEIGKRITSRFFSQLRWQEYKDDDWHGMSFDEKHFQYSISNSTDIVMFFKPRIIFNISANYRSEGQGGMRKTSDSWNLSTSLRGNLFNERLYIAMTLNDIFETSTPTYYTIQEGQYLRQNNNFYTRMFYLQLYYTFKGYRGKSKQVDTSRFGGI